MMNKEGEKLEENKERSLRESADKIMRIARFVVRKI